MPIEANVLELAAAVTRVGVGAFFAVSGYHKLFNKDRHEILVKTLCECHIPGIRFNQWFVPVVEFVGGLALVVGLGAPLAALGLLAICLVATCTDGAKRVRGWGPIDFADCVDCYLYLPEVIYAAILVQIVFGYGAAFSLNHLIGGALYGT